MLFASFNTLKLITYIKRRLQHVGIKIVYQPNVEQIYCKTIICTRSSYYSNKKLIKVMQIAKPMLIKYKRQLIKSHLGLAWSLQLTLNLSNVYCMSSVWKIQWQKMSTHLTDLGISTMLSSLFWRRLDNKIVLINVLSLPPLPINIKYSSCVFKYI